MLRWPGFVREVSGIHVLVGHPEQTAEGRFNCASLIYNGRVIAPAGSIILPNYSVFDEKRYFVPVARVSVWPKCAGIPLGITICEDIWMPEPARAAADAGARLLVNLNASPFHVGKRDEREAEVARRARDTACPVVYVNLVGGQDELVFDGESFVLDAAGSGLCACACLRAWPLPGRFQCRRWQRQAATGRGGASTTMNAGQHLPDPGTRGA